MYRYFGVRSASPELYGKWLNRSITDEASAIYTKPPDNIGEAHITPARGERQVTVMQRVLVIDNNKQPLMPCHPARARRLLTQGRAAVYRRYPFTIILLDRESGETQPVAFKVDPGSRTTGIALIADFQRGKRLVWAAELQHRGQQIKAKLLSRRQLRRGRRGRKTRYRPPRFNNRRRPNGWLPPSLMSRVYNIETWLARLSRFTPITSISQELVRFDTQAMENPEVSGMEYQQGTLWGYEVREYLLEKWGRKCAYCGAEDIPLEIEHIIPRARHGSNRVSNLTLACTACNQKKGAQTAEEFGYPDIQKQAKKPLRDAATINATRWKLYERLNANGLWVEVGTGGRTKYNRSKQGYPKTHWLDATCVGESGERVFVHQKHQAIFIQAMGHGLRQRVMTDKYGFPKTHRARVKRSHGYQTGDIARAIIPKGKHCGTYSGRVVIRQQPSFLFNGFNVHPKYLSMLHRADGYTYR